jgi:hypothetical protein
VFAGLPPAVRRLPAVAVLASVPLAPQDRVPASVPGGHRLALAPAAPFLDGADPARRLVEAPAVGVSVGGAVPRVEASEDVPAAA